MDATAEELFNAFTVFSSPAPLQPYLAERQPSKLTAERAVVDLTTHWFASYQKRMMVVDSGITVVFGRLFVRIFSCPVRYRLERGSDDLT